MTCHRMMNIMKIVNARKIKFCTRFNQPKSKHRLVHARSFHSIAISFNFFKIEIHRMNSRFIHSKNHFARLKVFYVTFIIQNSASMRKTQYQSLLKNIIILIRTCLLYPTLSHASHKTNERRIIQHQVLIAISLVCISRERVMN